jgi:hypothetical protein
MLNINVTHNFKQVSRAIGAIGKQARFAAAVALTRTAQDLQRQIPAELDKVLDNPTPFTKRGTYLVAAKRDNLRAEVGFRPVQARYMALQIEGGTVQPGAAGIKLPGNIQLNAFGNIPRGTIARLKAAAKSGTLGPAIAKRLNAGGNRRKGAAPIQLFYGQPTGSGWEDAPVGIWRRIPPTTPGGKGKLVPVIVFEDRPARYRQRFNFRALADRTVAARFPAHFQAELRKALATAR